MEFERIPQFTEGNGNRPFFIFWKEGEIVHTFLGQEGLPRPFTEDEALAMIDSVPEGKQPWMMQEVAEVIDDS